MAEEKKQPYKKMRMGAISATAWENKIKTKDGKEATFFTVTIERNYKDKDDKWARTDSYRVNDLSRVATVAQKMFEELAIKEQEEKE